MVFATSVGVFQKMFHKHYVPEKKYLRGWSETKLMLGEELSAMTKSKELHGLVMAAASEILKGATTPNIFPVVAIGKKTVVE